MLNEKLIGSKWQYRNITLEFYIETKSKDNRFPCPGMVNTRKASITCIQEKRKVTAAL